MRILSRYIFRQTAGALLLILASLTTVVWIAVALRQLELMTTQGQDAVRFLAMTTLAIPAMLGLIAPIALLIASIHVLNRLNGDSELIVMTAGGARTWALLKPLGLLAVLVALCVATINHVVGPWSQKTLREFVMLVRTDLMSQVLQPWRFTAPEQKLTIHIRDRSPDGQLLGLLMHDARDAKQASTYLAERGQILKQGGGAYLRMINGHVIVRRPNENAPQIIVFENHTVDLKQLEQRADQAQLVRPRERSTGELLRPDTQDPLYKLNPGTFVSEMHERFASPLYAFAFVLIVLAFVGKPQTTRQSRVAGLIAAFAIAIGCRILGIAATNAAVVRPSSAYMLYVIPITAAVIAAVAVQWQLYPRPPSWLARQVAAINSRLKRALATLWASRGGMHPARPATRG